MPPVVPASSSVLAECLAIFFALDEELDVQEVVPSKRALDVGNHPFGAAPEQVAEALLLLNLYSVVFVVATFAALKVSRQDLNKL